MVRGYVIRATIHETMSDTWRGIFGGSYGGEITPGWEKTTTSYVAGVEEYGFDYVDNIADADHYDSQELAKAEVARLYRDFDLDADYSVCRPCHKYEDDERVEAYDYSCMTILKVVADDVANS